MQNPIIYENKVLNYKGKTIFNKLILGTFKRVPKYFQEEEACFMFVDNASLIMRTPDKTIRFESGETMLAKCGNYYLEDKDYNEDKESKIILIGAYFYPSVIQDIFDFKSLNSTFTTNYDVTKIKMDSVLKNFRASIEFLLENPEIADEELILTKLKEFILLLSKTENAPSVLDFISSLFISPEYDFKKVIENNLYTSFSLDEIARMCNCSISTFKRKFIEIYNESPAKYIVKQKIIKSCLLLENMQEQIKNIAYDCGFESISTFNRVFKKLTGKSPSEYRIGLN